MCDRNEKDICPSSCSESTVSWEESNRDEKQISTFGYSEAQEPTDAPVQPSIRSEKCNSPPSYSELPTPINTPKKEYYPLLHDELHIWVGAIIADLQHTFPLNKKPDTPVFGDDRITRETKHNVNFTASWDTVEEGVRTSTSLKLSAPMERTEELKYLTIEDCDRIGAFSRDVDNRSEKEDNRSEKETCKKPRYIVTGIKTVTDDRTDITITKRPEPPESQSTGLLRVVERIISWFTAEPGTSFERYKWDRGDWRISAMKVSRLRCKKAGGPPHEVCEWECEPFTEGAVA